MIETRDYEPSDHNFIMSTWLRGYFYGNKDAHKDKDDFMASHHKLFESILNKQDTTIKIAILKEDPDVILGYAVYDLPQKLLYWTYVKTPFRQNGISKSLVPKDIDSHAFSTKFYSKIAKTKGVTTWLKK